VHWKLTGEKVVGIDDASGMFPIDSTINNFNDKMLRQFEELVSPEGFGWKIGDILAKALNA
jgi:sugar (pentulose or hexulose) kinase